MAQKHMRAARRAQREQTKNCRNLTYDGDAAISLESLSPADASCCELMNIPAILEGKDYVAHDFDGIDDHLAAVAEARSQIARALTPSWSMSAAQGAGRFDIRTGESH